MGAITRDGAESASITFDTGIEADTERDKEDEVGNTESACFDSIEERGTIDAEWMREEDDDDEDDDG